MSAGLAKPPALAPAALAPPPDPDGPPDPAHTPPEYRPPEHRPPEQLHPALWRASQLGGGRQRCTPTGFQALDEQLPGGGWPHGVLTELLLPRVGIGELRLLAPALARLAAGPVASTGPGHSAHAEVAATAPQADAGTAPSVMLFDPPAQLSAWGLVQQGLDPRHWLVVGGRGGHASAGPRPLAELDDGGSQAAPGSGLAGAAARVAPASLRHPRSANGLAPLLAQADVLWALEQALRSGHLGAVLAWLPPTLRADALRRLQLAAQAHDGPVFLFCDAQARQRPSAAPLRLLLQPVGVDGLQLRLLKRRGPLLEAPLRLQLPPVLDAQRLAQAQARLALRQAAQATAGAASGAASGGSASLRKPDRVR